MSKIRTDLEKVHQLSAQATGTISLMLEGASLSRGMLELAVRTLEEAAKKGREICESTKQR